MSTIQDTINALDNFTTATLSNAVNQLGISDPTEGFSDPLIRCLYPELGVMIGVAITVEIETMNPNVPNTGLGPLFVELLRQVDAENCPVVIVAKEVGTGSRFAAHCGEVIASSLKRLGAVGLFTDAAVRDVEEVRDLGFHFYSRGITPSSGNARLVRIGSTVNVGGIEIQPGDLIHGDADGLLKIPVEGREQLAEVAMQVQNGEGSVLEYIRSDGFTLEGLIEILSPVN